MRKVDHKDILQRARELSRTNLLFVFGVVKAVSLSIAVVIFLRLFSEVGSEFSWKSIYDHLPKFLMWVVSYMSLLLTYDSAVFGTLFLFHIPKKSETFWTFLLVGLETLQFAILSPSFILEEKKVVRVLSIDMVNWWYVIYGIYNISAAITIINLDNEIKKTIYNNNIHSLISDFRNKIKKAALLGFLIGSISISIFAVLSFSSVNSFVIQMLSSLIFIIVLFWAFYQHHQYREKLENIVDK